MSTATLVFDPFSEDFFNGPYETYRRMREEAPVYYSREYDFYALTRHGDVAAAYKDYESYSSCRGVDLAQVRKGESDGTWFDHRDGSAEPPAHA
jgi:cytochrome P450